MSKQQSSNRTFMELKLANIPGSNKMVVSSNRTFMELKYRLGAYNKCPTAVLIVPLWN